MSLLQVILSQKDHKGIIGIIGREKKLIRPEGNRIVNIGYELYIPISLFYTFYRASIKANHCDGSGYFFVVTAGGIFSEQLTLISAVIMMTCRATDTAAVY